VFDNEDWARFFEERMRDPLDRAFRLLLQTVPRATAERALRAALTVLVASDTRVGHPRFDVAAIPQRRREGREKPGHGDALSVARDCDRATQL
jgi:hypothetical protein